MRRKKRGTKNGERGGGGGGGGEHSHKQSEGLGGLYGCINRSQMTSHCNDNHSKPQSLSALHERERELELEL